MHRFALVGFFALAVVPMSASAASWHSFHNKALGLSLRYPGNWHAQVELQHGNRSVLLSHRGKASYAMTITLMPRRGRNLGRTLSVLRGDVPALAHVRWQRTTLAHRNAETALFHPSTEGGVNVSEDVIVAQWRGRAYEIVEVSYARHRLTRIDQFPRVYRQILATWKWR
ncbi:MAG: hypothetical protein ACRDFS_12160 [Chloroflexota bacterium]